MSYRSEKLKEIIGVTFESVIRENDEILFTAKDGRRWVMYYEPDCCASCDIDEIHGDLADLEGSPILQAEYESNSDKPRESEYADDSFTWGFFKLATIKGSVTIRWYGSSNGFYSEEACFASVGDDGQRIY